MSFSRMGCCPRRWMPIQSIPSSGCGSRLGQHQSGRLCRTDFNTLKAIPLRLGCVGERRNRCHHRHHRLHHFPRHLQHGHRGMTWIFIKNFDESLCRCVATCFATVPNVVGLSLISVCKTSLQTPSSNDGREGDHL